jgi:AbrB family looped-hinge helix DNA binding protein
MKGALELKIQEDGSVLIPAQVRKEMKLQAGDFVEFRKMGEGVYYLWKVTR